MSAAKPPWRVFAAGALLGSSITVATVLAVLQLRLRRGPCPQPKIEQDDDIGDDVWLQAVRDKHAARPQNEPCLLDVSPATIQHFETDYDIDHIVEDLQAAGMSPGRYAQPNAV